jgi:hypothetical protein
MRTGAQTIGAGSPAKGGRGQIEALRAEFKAEEDEFARTSANTRMALEQIESNRQAMARKPAG